MAGLDNMVQNAAQSQQDRGFTDEYVQRVQPEAAANIDFQFPANQKGVEKGGHQHCRQRVAFDGDAAGQIHDGGCDQRSQGANNGV